MKTNSKTKLVSNLVALLILLVAVSSCNEVTDNESVDSEEVAEILAGALAKDAQGMTAQMQASAEAAEDIEFSVDSAGRTSQVSMCGQEYSEEFSLQSEDNQAVFYDYAFEYLYTFECNQFMVPNFMDFTMSQSGEFDAPRYGSSNTSNASWNLSGLEISSTQYSIEGNYGRSGQHASKVRDQNDFQFELAIEFSDVKMNKGNFVISQGQGSFSISGSSSTGADFSSNGSLEFLGGQQILVTINGTSYMVNLWTGDVSPV